MARKNPGVLLLRAINVGGHVVPMDRLREIASSLGYPTATTYIQSGNLLLDDAADNVEEAFETKLRDVLGYAVTAFFREAPELGALAARARDVEAAKRYVTFAKALPDSLRVPSDTPKGDIRFDWKTSRDCVSHSLMPEVGGISPNPYLERAFSLAATTRNDRVVEALWKLAAKASQG